MMAIIGISMYISNKKFNIEKVKPLLKTKLDRAWIVVAVEFVNTGVDPGGTN